MRRAGRAIRWPPGGVVLHYRIYRVDKDGHVVGPSVPVECNTDGDAIEEARKCGGWTAVELWKGAEMIHRFEADR
jgi:hypothetical protein